MTPRPPLPLRVAGRFVPKPETIAMAAGRCGIAAAAWLLGWHGFAQVALVLAAFVLLGHAEKTVAQHAVRAFELVTRPRARGRWPVS